MPDSLFRADSGNYFLLRATVPSPENVLLTVFRVTELDWAEEVAAQAAAVPEPAFGWESVTSADPYLRVDVWRKYFFPTFGSEPGGEGPAYQWYSLADAAELQQLLAACVQAAAAHGVVLGSR